MWAPLDGIEMTWSITVGFNLVCQHVVGGSKR
jgi:hypothetical protein